ncbi:MAG: GTP-binding protein TypA/BipA [Candidatus Falkowbacteria bacterium GW2011_GWC2_38_22]|uniref:50S ribosomal subunit assembly factor BipA n=1 Tax=Candidatus Falkowbacteria bacterium GW2011_GWE1_38_31 TaxID=1618638 RepID=A0A0G0JWJ9_9BACT|nr:MAG: GTP-binding protein TypA/BipA [Candidatus Falkowbacteria bacterium GW2011_GWF2_38_1205]KKQ62162.1 MAG: GTP-binding protein TypA/BipA [Candidatus Falkowbacteria bacterium GW2011_GWC2_38_22]KKQ64312.1 MAG: GTP-binding protein TypA/BipA [Candidatus Falkowbacteria bacterium GW2011_GWF1_38_22]KKQ66289.1 MAG: GTP-binding protein TypA/BipA [Candidatus Falkowbacteria bacterium GW2011_GWE2_38_254]KKQ71017.1 MAG: GTP-binding protein TypA/BipA [Candidatus Falkowbacteria bacterium GW2011_GWE1_38_31
MDIRNIAIIAHVDHGKTTLTDALMRQTGMSEEGVSMDSNALELERGITIYSKNTSVYYKDTKINIVDTPGHADFGSEVERVLRSIDSVLLVVDAQEGPMPQTKFVLKKSLELGLKPIVVINKIDKPAARAEEVKEMVYELFLDLGANDEQLDFTTIYAIAKQGIAKLNMDDNSDSLSPLLDVILKQTPIASSADSNTRPLSAQPFNLGYDNFLGRLAISRIYEGTIKSGSRVLIKDIKNNTREGKISKLFTFEGLTRKEVSEAYAGDIIMTSGLPNIFIGETICDNENQPALPAIEIDEPTITLNFLVNTSPFAGREGKLVTNSKIKERLLKELEINVGLKIDFSAIDHYKVSGRGEMHIAILLENMRREGYEIQISQPHVIIKEENGEKLEPFEELTINVPENMTGTVIEKLSKRRGAMLEMKPEHGHTRIIFEIPTRGLLGYRNDFVVDTKGEGILYSRVIGFKPYVGEIEKHTVGSMISMASGKALGFSLYNLQDRGDLYIGANVDIYEGMVVGNVAKGNDLAVNPTKGKHLTNMRASGADEAIRLTPPVELTLERGMSIMKDDEYLEITPKSVRLRKQYLTENERVRAGRAKI